MQPQFITKPAFSVVGMLIHTQGMSPEIPQLWQHFGPRMDEVQHQVEPGASYGLMDHFDSESGALDYMAGVAVVEAIDLPAGMSSWQVPTQTYAVFTATLSTIGAAFDQIYNTWLPTSGYRQAVGPYFEHYGATFDPGDPASTFSIYIPVAIRASGSAPLLVL